MLLMSLLGGHSEIDFRVLLILDLVLFVLSMLVQWISWVFYLSLCNFLSF